jgi:uncharacterized protein YjbI with pentapeptide repeats
VFTSIGEFAARSWASRVGRVILIALGVLVLFAVFVWILPPLLARGSFETDAERLKAENDVRGTLLQALAGAFLLLGLYFTARTLQLNREGQITERFTRAIDQLGKDTPDVRLGGIYALERIANDSPRDRRTIFEVLAAFIREHSHADPSENNPRHDASEDVRAAATVLGRRKAMSDDRALDLRGASVGDAVLSGADFRGANLAGANLEGANLLNADLWGATLERANLRGASLGGANLEGANLARANLEGAKLERANLMAADLAHANLERADLMAAELVDAILERANLARANLGGANLGGAILEGAKLSGVNFYDANLEGANLTAALGLDQAVALDQAVGLDQAIGLDT